MARSYARLSRELLSLEDSLMPSHIDVCREETSELAVIIEVTRACLDGFFLWGGVLKGGGSMTNDVGKA